MIGLGIIAYMNQLSVFWVVVVAFICAFCNVLFNPCSTSVFADVLPNDELIRGQSIYNGGYSLISLAGQSLSGMMIVNNDLDPVWAQSPFLKKQFDSVHN